jgi:hypothetical protein
MIGTRTKRAVAAAALVVWLAQPAFAQGTKATSNCPSPVVEAMHVRLLQTELMVAALQCRNVPTYDFSSKYNSFVMQFSSPLTQNANVLKDHFRKNYGANHMTQLDRYMTRIANDAGQRGANLGYCQQMVPIYDKVLALKGSSSELTKFSNQNPLALAISTRDGC